MSLEISRIQAILLDVDGTLIDTDDQMVHRLIRLLKRLPFLPSRVDARRLARRIVMGIETPGNAVLHLLDHIGMDGPLAALEEFAHRRGWRKPPGQVILIPGVRGSLDTLRIHYPLAIVSARSTLGVQAFLDRAGLTHMFRCIVTGQTRPFTKPHPDPIIYAASQLGVHPSACLMVGDTRYDILSGRQAGAQTVGVLCGFGREAELRRAGADLILPSTSDLPAVLLDGEGD